MLFCSLTQHHLGFLEGLDEEVDVVEVVVEAEGDSNGTGDGECVN